MLLIGHCKKLAPTWSELGQSFEKDSDVVIAHVDCTKAKKVCSNAKVTYQTMVQFVFACFTISAEHHADRLFWTDWRISHTQAVF